jgi:NAD(P)-dependent dehydrogenase (short-subunit alcohol dehydrogenase family)
MTEGTASVADPPRLLGQTVVIVDAGSGIGLETARKARAEGARLIITGRDAGRLDSVADEIGVEATATFDSQDLGRLEAFLADLPTCVQQVMLGVSPPYYAPLDEIDLPRARDALERLLLPLSVARFAAREMADGGSLVVVGPGRARPAIGGPIAAMSGAALPALIANLALEVAPVRVNLIAAASAYDRTDGVAELAVHLMANTAVTGATYVVGGAP